MNKIKFFLAATFIVLSLMGSAQQTASYRDHHALFEQGKTLYQAKKYAAAREVLSSYLKENTQDYSEDLVEAEYLRAMAAMRLNNKDAELLLDKFVEKYPEKSRTKRVFFQLAINQFANHSYGDALDNFEKTDIAILRNEEIIEYYFKYGYSLYRMRKPEKAQVAFSEVKDLDSPYAVQAKYYFSHIAYENKNYQTALEGFKELKNDATYGNLVSYYIVHIYYHQDRPELLVEEGLPLMETINEDRKPELAQLIGEAYYRLSDYEKATEYLEFYQMNTKKRVSRENQYQLAFTYFQIEDYENAILSFQEAIDSKRDSLAQNAYYHLGMCYIETDQPQFAGNAFYSSYKIPVNQKLREDALYNYVKLSYENPFSPYNQAVDAVKKYMAEFPDSRHMDEINSFLVDIFLSSKDYQSAITAFKEIDNKTERLKKAYQKISFYQGVELFKKEEYFEAIKHFKEAIEYDYDMSIVARSRFWIGDAYYQYKNYDLAYDYFDEFLVTSGAYSLKLFPTAYYNQGYILFSQKKYDLAKDAFRKYVIGRRYRKDELLADAYIRLGDCFFIDKDYTQAIANYDKAIKMNARNDDYALYQKALAYGGKGDLNNKILQLDALLRTQKDSPFRDDATFEMGLTYLIQNKSNEALKRFRDVYTDFPHSVLAKKAYLKSGLLYYNSGQNDQALRLLKKVAEKYPNTPDAQEALSSIKNIYIDMNQVDEYFAYAKNLDYTTVTASEQDSATYVSAENIYMQGDCGSSSEGFNKYLKLYPDGSFAINAHFYLAQCAYQAGNNDKALEHYEFVVGQGRTQFTETSLVKSSKILYEKEAYRKALDYFKQLYDMAEYEENKLIALKGQTRSYYKLNDYNMTIKWAEKLLKHPDVDEVTKTRTHLFVARSAMELNDTALAEKEFGIIEGSSLDDVAAEANYNLALIDYHNAKYDQVENRIFEISEKYAGQDFWLAKAFVLLGDVYVKTGNLFQAKQTLQSIIDNYDGKELVNEAKARKQRILELEKQQEAEKLKQEKQAKKDEQDVDNY